MTSEFTSSFRVEFADTDMAGIVHFANFYRYMEVAEHNFFRSLGLSIVNDQEDGSVISWPRVSASCSFKAPAYYNDNIDVRVLVARIGVKSLTLNYEFHRGDTLLATGTMKTVCCRIRHGHPLESIEIPPMYGDLIEEAEDARVKK